MTDNTTHADRLAQSRAEDPVIAELNRLKNKPCLGMHVWEHAVGELPETILSELKRDDAEIDAARARHDPFLLSLSLVPSTKRARCAIRPYMTMENLPNRIGYLFDLDQYQEDRPIVTRIFETNLDSFRSAGGKKYCLDKVSDVPEIEDTKKHSAQLMVEHAMGPEGPGSTQRQFLGLDRHMHSTKVTKIKKNDFWGHAMGTVEHSELLASLKYKHVKAIFVPYFTCRDHVTRLRYEAEMQLEGAIAGLQHWEAGYPLPVVIYHVAGPNQGKFTLLGKDRETLLNVAEQAVSVLATDNRYAQTTNALRIALRNYSGDQGLVDPIGSMTARIAAERAKCGPGELGT